MSKLLKHFYIRKDQCKRLEKESLESKISQAEIVRKAIDKYFGIKNEN